VQLDRKVFKVLPDRKVQLARKAHRVFKVMTVSLALRDRKEFKVRLVQRVRKDQRALAQQEQRVLPVLLDLQVLKAQLVLVSQSMDSMQTTLR
jgi:hypothetical protein